MPLSNAINEATHYVLLHFRSEAACAACSSLDAEELARAARFHFPRDAARFRYFRHQLRLALAEMLGEERPEKLKFTYGEHGKPQLADYPALHFNLSHTGDTAAVVISTHGAVGVDLERLDATFPVREIAANYFHGPEISAVLQARDEAEATERFYRYWTAKEALMKATGLGMSLEPQHIHLTLDVRTLQPSGIARIAYAGLDAAHWTLHVPPPPAGLALAVVTGN